MSRTLKILLADDHSILRTGLKVITFYLERFQGSSRSF